MATNFSDKNISSIELNAEKYNLKSIPFHATETEWSTDHSNYIPKQGEIVVYDKDDTYNYERIKVGDGLTSIINLPFYSTEVIIDVVELPIDNINEQVFYRIPKGMFVASQGVMEAACYVVNGLPTTGEPVTIDGQSINAGYYDTQTNDVHGYLSGTIAGAVGVPAGWYSFSTLAPMFGVGWIGVIGDILDCPIDDSIGLLLEGDIYYHKYSWRPVNPIGLSGTGIMSTVFNHPANISSGYYSHAEGRKTTASSDYSHAEGRNTTASGNSSHAEGYGTTASGVSSHAEGNDTTASGNSSHAEGYGTTASDDFSHAEGYDTTASGHYSHAEGCMTTASGINSHAEGRDTIASRQNQHAQGAYNVEDSTAIHIVGNGTSDTDRKNIHTIGYDGSGWFQGDVYVGSTSGVNKDEGSKKLATEEYVQQYVGGSSGGASVPSDWNAAEGEAGHVLNRTHWVDFVEVLSETNLTRNAGEDYFSLPDTLDLIIGREYTVKWNGIEYTCAAVEAGNNPLVIGLGNLAAMGVPVEASNEPFAIAEIAGDSNIAIYPLDDSTSLTISIRENIVRKLDNKYLDFDWIPSKVGRVILEEQTVENGRLEAIDAQYLVNGTPIIVYVNGVPHETKIVVEGYECYANFTAMDSVSVHGEVSLVFNSLATNIFFTNLNGQSVKICLAEYEKIPEGYLPDNNAVQYTEQTLTEAQKAQARQNIGAAAVGEGGGASVPSNWLAAEGEAGHVLNRTHYSEYQNMVIYSGTDLVPDADMGAIVIPEVLSLVPNEEYIVNWNGVEYTCVCVGVDDEYGGINTFFGNLGAIEEGFEDTGEPFVFASYPSDGYSLVAPLDGSASVTVSISGAAETVHELDEKYIKQALTRAEERMQSYTRNWCNTVDFYFQTDIQEGNTDEALGEEAWSKIRDALQRGNLTIFSGKVLGKDWTLMVPMHKYTSDYYVGCVQIESIGDLGADGDIYTLRIIVMSSGYCHFYLRRTYQRHIN